MEKDALAKQLAAAISTCAALNNSTDRSVEIRATGAHPPSQAAAAGGCVDAPPHACDADLLLALFMQRLFATRPLHGVPPVR